MLSLASLLRRWGHPHGTGGRDDVRSHRIVALIECHLNQNARDSGAATHPGCNPELVALLSDAGVGIVTLPCPECHALGPARERPPGTPLRAAMQAPASAARCRELAAECAVRLAGARAQGSTVLAVLGGDVESPGCAVHPPEQEHPVPLAPPSGVFLRALDDELRLRGLVVPFRGLRESDPAALARDLAWIRERVRA